MLNDINDIPGAKNITEFESSQYKTRLSIALKAAKICVFEVDIVRQLYTFFENSEDIFGVPGEAILKDVQPYSKLSPAEYEKAVTQYFSHPDDAAVINKAFHSIFAGEATTYEARMRASGSDFTWCKINVTPIVENNVPIKMIGVITDITDLKIKSAKLEKAVKLDRFTGLYDKNNSIALIEKLLREKPNRRHALILSDIDNFKNFNDVYGHTVGDRIIKLAADTLKKSFRKTDIIGRYGGDEFIILVEDIPDDKWLTDKLEKLVRCHEGDYSCTNSIGVSIFPQNGEDFKLLFEKADKALYKSKLTKEAYSLYAESCF